MMTKFIISTDQPIGDGAYLEKIEKIDIIYEANGAITNLSDGVTFKILFDIPVNVTTFTFEDDGVMMMGHFANGEWRIVDHFDVSYEANGAITNISPQNVTFADDTFTVPVNVPFFNFEDDGVAMMGDFANGKWRIVDHFDVSYEANGAITNISHGVTFADDTFTVPVNVTTFNFEDDGVMMMGHFANGEWRIEPN